MQELLLAVARGLVEDKEAVKVTVDFFSRTRTVSVGCAPLAIQALAFSASIFTSEG